MLHLLRLKRVIHVNNIIDGQCAAVRRHVAVLAATNAVIARLKFPLALSYPRHRLRSVVSKHSASSEAQSAILRRDYLYVSLSIPAISSSDNYPKMKPFRAVSLLTVTRN